MTSTSSFGDITDAAEWMRIFETIEGEQEEMRNELNDAQQKGVGNRLKRNIMKRG